MPWNLFPTLLTFPKPMLRFTGQVIFICLKKKKMWFRSYWKLSKPEAHGELGPGTRRRLWTQRLQRETFRAVLLLELWLALAKSQIPKEAVAANVHK